MSKFEEFFNTKFTEEENGLINAICFVVKSSDNRVTEFQKLIISSILNLFGKNAGSNFLALLTHSDTCNPDAVKVMTKEIVQFKKKEENKEAWYWCVSSIKYFENLIKRQDKGKFDDNIEDFISFTNNVVNLPAIDMTLTKKNLYLKKTLNELKKTIKDEYLTILLEKYDLLNISAQNLDAQIKICNEKNEELQKKLNELKKKTDEQNNIQNKINALQKDINVNNTKINQCNNDINYFKSDLESINQSISSLEAVIKKGEEEKNNLNAEKKLAEKKFNEIQDKIKNYQGNNTSNFNIDELKKQLSDQQLKINKLNKNIQSLNSQKEEIQNKINNNINKKSVLYNKIQNSKNEINKIKKEKAEKTNEQMKILKQYDNSAQNYSITLLKEYLDKLQKSKNDKKTIKESYIESYEIKSNERVLRCTSCKKNCHVGCDCKYGLFFFLGVSWWCNHIVSGYCNVCGCYYKIHKREKMKYKHEKKERTKTVGLTEKEIANIDKNIKEIELKIIEEEKLQNKINEHSRKIDAFENAIDSEEKIIWNLEESNRANNDTSNQLSQDIKKNEDTKTEIQKNIEETTQKLQKAEMEKKLNDKEKDLKNTEKKIKENKEKKEIFESNQKNKEKQINLKNIEIQKAKALINSRKTDIKNEQLEKTKVENEIKKLTSAKDDLLNKIKTDFEKEKNRLQGEKDRISKEINVTEKEAIKQIIKMKIITDETKKIQIVDDQVTFNQQLNDILEDNKTFIKNSKSFDSLKTKINTVLKEPEEKILREYGINKDNLINLNYKKA